MQLQMQFDLLLKGPVHPNSQKTNIFSHLLILLYKPRRKRSLDLTVKSFYLNATKSPYKPLCVSKIASTGMKVWTEIS